MGKGSLSKVLTIIPMADVSGIFLVEMGT